MTLREFLIFCSKEFHRIPRYDFADRVISWTVTTLPQNTELQHVLTKVALINSLYNTNIYDIFKIAEHICRQNIDPKVQKGNLTVVDDIRHGHGIVTVRNVERDLYAFATKYVNWHNPTRFPIFDNLIKRLLPILNKRYNFYQTKFTQDRLYDYYILKSVIDSLTSQTQLEDFRYKKIDQALWLYAKYTHNKRKFPPQIFKEIQNAERNLLEHLKEFRKNTIRLGGIWKGVKVTDEDIKEIRQELLKKLEEKW